MILSLLIPLFLGSPGMDVLSSPVPSWSWYLPIDPEHPPQPRLLPIVLASPVSASLLLPCLGLKNPRLQLGTSSPQVASGKGVLLQVG